MRRAARILLLSLAMTIAIAEVAAPADSSRASRDGTVKSSSVELVGSGLNSNILFLREDPSRPGEWGNLPRIMLELVNRTDRAVWVIVRLSAPIPDRVCEQRFSLGRRERTRTLCTQDSVVADVDYSVGVTVFADSGFADRIESTSWNVRLRRSEVEEWREKRRLEQGREASTARSPGAVASAPPTRPTAAPNPISHAALHLAIRDIGMSFGNAPRVHGLRFNWRDRELQQADGFDLTVVGVENPGAAIHGIGVLLYSGFSVPWVDDIVGVGVSPTALGAKRTRGVMLGAGSLSAADAVGVQLGGLALALSGRSIGVQASGIVVFGGPMSGITAAGIFGWSEFGPMTGVNVGGIGLRAPTVAGLSVGGLFVAGDQRVIGISAAGLGLMAGDHLIGIGASPLVFSPHIAGIATGGWVGRSGWVRRPADAATLRGIAVAGVVATDNLTGFSVAGYHRIDSVQRGVSIGLVNDAGELHGIQLGILNTARNNRGAFRTLPVLNVHFGR